MSEWDLMTEAVQRAMTTPESKQPKTANLAAMAKQLQRKEQTESLLKLQKELETIARLISPQSTVAADEITDLVVRSLTGSSPAYRRSRLP